MNLHDLYEKPNHAAFCFGRMNPPTLGHGELLKKVAEEGGDNYFIVATKTHKLPDNPLPYLDKINFIKKLFPQYSNHVVEDPSLTTIMKTAAWVYNQGFRSVTFVAGSDRLSAFQELLDKYNGQGEPGQDGYYNFSVINYVSSGERDPDAEGVVGYSASKARTYAQEGNFEKFAEVTGAGELTQELYDAVRAAQSAPPVKKPTAKKPKDLGEAKRAERPLPKTELKVGDNVVADTSKEDYPGGHKQRSGKVTRVGEKGVHIRTGDNDEPEWHPYKIVKKSTVEESNIDVEDDYYYVVRHQTDKDIELEMPSKMWTGLKPKHATYDEAKAAYEQLKNKHPREKFTVTRHPRVSHMGGVPTQTFPEGVAEGKGDCPPATQDITLNLKNRKKAIDEYGYGPLNPDLPNTKFWMRKVDEWNLDSEDEAKQSLCGNCAAFDVRQNTLDCIAQGIDTSDPEDAAGVIDAGELGYCKFLKFKCASRRTCDAWVTGGPLTDKQDMAPDQDIKETIRKVKDGYRLVSSTGKNLGTYPTHAGAERRERQVQYFKHVNEDNDSDDNIKNLFYKFLPLAAEYLGLKKLPKINIELTLPDHNGQASFGGYNSNTKEINLAIANRHPVDIFRTLAHELVHYKQDMLGKIKDYSGETGSTEENQANSIAGIIMRLFNKAHPDAMKAEIINTRPRGIEEDVVDDTVQYHDTLEPTVWENGVLKPEIRNRLLTIAKKFIDNLNIDNFDAKDIVLTGSMANYNYTKFSDFDLHVVTDYDSLECAKIAEEFYQSKKRIWNRDYDIEINGHDVELYVEDDDKPPVSGGVYSILDNRWIKEPSHKNPEIDVRAVRAKTREYIKKIHDALNGHLDAEAIGGLVNKLRGMRTAGLEQGGEYSVENLAYKTLRNAGILDMLSDLRKHQITTDLSL